MSGILQILNPIIPSTGSSYATWNPSDKGSNVILSNSNKTAVVESGGGSVRDTIVMPTNKYYWEITINTVSSGASIGIGNSSALLTEAPGNADNNSIGYFFNGLVIKNGSVIATWSSPSGGHIIGVAYDATARTLAFYNNAGTLLGTITSANIPTGNLYAMVGGTTSCDYTANFGASAFAHTVPTGYQAGIF